tara:strand:- start:17725 stop:17925 length:201 start_codon:yes stop_codon:yes gene_type:complete
MSTRKDRSVPWILRYRERKDLSKKIRKTEAAVKKAKAEQDWGLVMRLKYLLRKSWWGYKKIKSKYQ